VDPYRSDHSARTSSAETPRDRGIVGDIIAQFADPLAFYRELIQNSIDAGSPSVDVKLDYDASASVVRVVVRDRGEGMTRDILENQLLVLFRSTKEKDDSKIGKFGIGFTSVLSPNPEVVVVQTSRDGRRLTLHLQRDLTYQLFDSGPATQTGTSVELDLAMRSDQVAEFARTSIEALTRWCRHASVPVHFVANLPAESGGDKLEARIDRPLAIDGALVEVSRTTDDGKLTVVAGLLAGATPYLGFFNHGLMLHESSESPLGPIAVKIQDGRLGHTLSRDDVRRDASLDRALAFARDVIAEALPRAAATELHRTAQSDHARWALLASAICTAKLELPRSSWWFPLLAASGQALAIHAPGLGRTAWVASSADALTARLIERGEHVLVAPPNDRSFLAKLVESLASCRLRDVEGLTAITPVEPSAADTAVLAIMTELFALTYRAPRPLFVAKLDGKYGEALAVSCEGDGAQLVDDDQAAKNPFGRRTCGLAISARHGWYRAARDGDPRAGASLLVRVLLNEHDLLDAPRSTALLDDLLVKIGVKA